jgi:glycosyltransferase involved in cell wall biosynthesis
LDIAACDFKLMTDARATRTEPAGRRTVVMLCPHEPTLDPRVHWEAEGAAKHFGVTVVGFPDAQRERPAQERCDGYEIRRMRTEAGVVKFALRLLTALTVPEALVAITFLVPSAVIIAPFFALLWGYGRFKHRLVASPQGRLFRDRMIDVVLRAGLPAVYLAVRHQFAPATETFFGYLKALPRAPEVVHCNDLQSLLAGVLGRQRLGCRVIYDAHEYYPHSNPEGTAVERWTYHWLEKVLVRKVDAVVTVNPMMASVIGRAYGLSTVYSVPNAEPLSATPIRALRSPMTDLAAGRVRFLFQGRFARERGLEEVISAWAGVDGEKAALFLRGPQDPPREHLEQLARSLGLLGKSIYFLEPVVEEELVAASAEADVGLIPYKGAVAGYRYACPNKLSQYLHAGLAVLSNDLPYVRAVVEESNAGVIYSDNRPESLVAAVHKLSGDSQGLAKLRANAVRYAYEKFNWQAFADTLYNLYASAGPTGASLHRGN